MKTHATTTVRLCALAVGVALAAAVPALAGSIDHRPVVSLNGGTGRVGPGIGSIKSPFGVLENGTPGRSRSEGDLYFDSSDGQAVQQVPAAQTGPGPWSYKSPTWGLYNGH